jgi:hypothetical protein
VPKKLRKKTGPAKRPRRVPTRKPRPQAPLPNTADLVHAARTAVPHDLTNMTPTQAAALRELFWQNVVREILTSLSMASAQRMAMGNPDRDSHADIVPDVEPPMNGEGIPEHGGPAAGGHDIEPPRDNADQQELFDGRMALLMKSGERIPIGDVFPVFACGINTELERSLSVALECSVFQVRTPRGQVYTIPLHEVRAFHALSPELMRRLEQSARRQHKEGGVPEQVPFGFAAFTSLARGALPFGLEPAPEHPTE